MMKKMTAILLAVAVSAMSTAAFAAKSTGQVENSRNANTTFASSAEDTDKMPSFKPGDTVKFTISGLNEGDWVTFLTYKNGEEPSNSTTQYIDQYVAESSILPVDYVVRDIGNGVYNLKINSNDNQLYTAYYKVSEEDSPVPVITCGDVNSDGVITAKDTAILARYLANWAGYDESKVDIDMADTNDDGAVTAKDNTILARYIAHWAGYETLPVK